VAYLANAHCERCRTPVRKKRYCATCRQVIAHLGPQYRYAAANILTNSGPLSQDWANLEQWRNAVSLPLDNLIADLAGDWLNRCASTALLDGNVTAEALAVFQRAAAALGWPQSAVALNQQLQRERQLTMVRAGHLPIVDEQNSLMLPRGERCHMWVQATRWRELKSGPQATKGSLIITDKRIQFRTLQGAGDVGLSKVLGVHYKPPWVIFESTNRTMSGNFRFADPQWVATVALAAIQIERKILHPAGPAAVNRSDEINLMTGEEFEDYVAELLRHVGWHVTHTARTGDFGVDLIATSGHIRKAVQCKRFSQPVGVSAVQEVVAGAIHHGCTSSMVVTNTTFTRAARDLAYTHNCELVGSDQLLRASLEADRQIS
jgi:restriction system protein